jgi:ankyrin repeat protein
LHYAVVGEQPAVVSLLLKKGADPKIQDTDGNTPLSLAEARHLEAIINLLLQGSGK